MTLFSENDKNLWGSIKNNKLAALVLVSWFILFRKNTPHWILEAMANFLMLDDGMDIGLFNRLHHWQTAYIMKILNLTKKHPVSQRRPIIIKGLSSMFDAQKRENFLRGI